MKSAFTDLTGTAAFENRTFSSEEIKQIGQSKRLLGISFVNCPITDEEIREICNLPKLVNVLLENTKITDKSLAYLSQLPNLKYLFITKADITGSGFKYFENNRKIECIWACSTKLDDENLRLLAKIPKLGTLLVNDTSVTFDGLLSIANNPRVKVVAKDMFTIEQMELFESEQRKLAKKKQATNDIDIELAKEKLLAFFNAITVWEKYATELGDDAFKYQEELKIKCSAIFNQFCTEKSRKGGRPESIHFSGGPNYSYGQQNIIDVEQPSKNKIYFYTKDPIDFQYRYILVKKDNEWKIDEKQWQSGGWKKDGL